MCLAVYLASDHPLETLSGPRLTVERLKRRAWPGDVFGGKPVYGVLLGCACLLLSDGVEGEEERERQALLAELQAYLAEAANQAPIQALVCWAGDEKKPPEGITVSPAEIARFDFDRAWDVPMRLIIRHS